MSNNSYQDQREWPKTCKPHKYCLWIFFLLNKSLGICFMHFWSSEYNSHLFLCCEIVWRIWRQIIFFLACFLGVLLTWVSSCPSLCVLGWSKDWKTLRRGFFCWIIGSLKGEMWNFFKQMSWSFDDIWERILFFASLCAKVDAFFKGTCL